MSDEALDAVDQSPSAGDFDWIENDLPRFQGVESSLLAILVKQAREANALRAENAELRRDAERWRAIRNPAIDDVELYNTIYNEYDIAIGYEFKQNEELDQALDAAIAKGATP